MCLPNVFVTKLPGVCLTIGPSTRCRWVDREPTAGESAPGAEEGVRNGLSWRHFQLQGVDGGCGSKRRANAGSNRAKRTREFLEG
jgi:hypothetical protein